MDRPGIDHGLTAHAPAIARLFTPHARGKRADRVHSRLPAVTADKTDQATKHSHGGQLSGHWGDVPQVVRVSLFAAAHTSEI
jgi:hypothetical protein